jgi:hypothetical protein
MAEKKSDKTVAAKEQAAAQSRKRKKVVQRATDIVVDMYGAAIKELANR